MELDAFVDAVTQHDMATIYTCTSGDSAVAWGLSTWVPGVKGYITLRNGALYVLDDNDDAPSTEHGPFATFDEAYAMYILLGSCRAGN